MSCVDCAQEFVFTAGEQEFFASRGFTEAPKRCGPCRQARKAQRSSSGGFSSGGGGYSSRGSFGGGGGYGGDSYGERRPREMFSATCAECGQVAQVPFQPTGAGPVYCSDCFQTRR